MPKSYGEILQIKNEGISFYNDGQCGTAKQKFQAAIFFIKEYGEDNTLTPELLTLRADCAFNLFAIYKAENNHSMALVYIFLSLRSNTLAKAPEDKITIDFDALLLLLVKTNKFNQLQKMINQDVHPLNPQSEVFILCKILVGCRLGNLDNVLTGIDQLGQDGGFNAGLLKLGISIFEAEEGNFCPLQC